MAIFHNEGSLASWIRYSYQSAAKVAPCLTTGETFLLGPRSGPSSNTTEALVFEVSSDPLVSSTAARSTVRLDIRVRVLLLVNPCSLFQPVCSISHLSQVAQEFKNVNWPRVWRQEPPEWSIRKDVAPMVDERLATAVLDTLSEHTPGAQRSHYQRTCLEAF